MGKKQTRAVLWWWWLGEDADGMFGLMNVYAPPIRWDLLRHTEVQSRRSCDFITATTPHSGLVIVRRAGQFVSRAELARDSLLH